MKFIKLALLLIYFKFLCLNIAIAQQSCFECPDNTASGLKSAAFGYENTAAGDYSFTAGRGNIASDYSTISLGYGSESEGQHAISIGRNCYSHGNSFSLGQNARANVSQSLAIGRYVQTNASGAIVIGSSSSSMPLINGELNSLMIGFNSGFPTLFVGPTPYGEEFGKVGIGTTEPVANLDVNGSIRIKEFYYPDPNAQNGYVLSFNPYGKAEWRYIAAGLWETNGQNIWRTEGNVGIGTDHPLSKFQLGDKWTFNNEEIKSIGYNVLYANERYYTMYNGPGSLLNFEPSGAISLWMAPNGPGGAPVEELVESVIFDNFGNVGIGTRTPSSKLDVAGKIKTNEIQLTEGCLNGYVLRSHNDGTAYWADPADLNDGDWQKVGDDVFVLGPKKVGIGTMYPGEMLHVTENVIIQGNIKGARNNYNPFTIFAGNNIDDGAYMTLAGNYDNTGSIKLYCKGINSRIEFHNDNMQVMSIRANNSIVIGDPNEEMITMYVNGYIEANKVRVSTEFWNDDVFRKGYQLRSLHELEEFINTHHHLPEVPKEHTVIEKGIDLAEMNAILLKKIEELTLYTIRQQKEIELLRSEISKINDNYE